MKKLYLTLVITSTILSGTSFATHTDSDQARIKAKQLHKEFENTIPGQLLDATLFYTAAGWWLKGAGNFFHEASGLPPYEYLQKQVGQANTVEYPQITPKLSRTKQCFAKTAHTLLSLGSAAHWPLRSARDFSLGLFDGIVNISHHIKYPTTRKEAIKETFLRSPIGMAVGLAAYGFARKLHQMHAERRSIKKLHAHLQIDDLIKNS